MEIILSHISALEFWRSGQEHILLQPNSFCDMENIMEAEDKLRANDIRRLREPEFRFLSNPISLLVPKAEDRRVFSDITCHVCPENLPHHSLVKICDNVYACRPEFTFVQVARKTIFPQLVFAGLEFCGAFRMPVSKNPALFQRAPLTTSNALASYVMSCRNMYGTVEAKRALLYVADGSESPMEAKLLIILCFPMRLGGYGLPMPVLNMEIKTTDEIRKATGKTSFRCDMLWPEAGVAVEYDGSDHELRIASDAIRRTALSELGIDASVTVTKEQLKNEVQLDFIVKRLRWLLRVRKKATLRDWSSERRNLRAILGLP